MQRQYIITESNSNEQFLGIPEGLVLQLPDAEQLPESLSWGSPSTSCVRDLDLSACANLKQLPAALCSLTSLQSLSLGGQQDGDDTADRACAQLTALPANLGNLTALQHLNLSGCRSLKQLPESLSRLQVLQQLHLAGCSNLQQLPSNLGRLGALQHLHLAGCNALLELPESLGSLGRLKVLDLGGCSTLQQLPSGLRRCTALQRLTVSGCVSLCSLPPSLGSCSRLQQLSIAGCSRLQQLPGSCRKLTALQQFDFQGCPACEGLTDTACSPDALNCSQQQQFQPSQVDNTALPAAGAGWKSPGLASSICVCWPWRRKHSGQQAPAAQGSAYQLVRSALLLQRHRSAVAKLATQQEPMLTTLERMSWLVVLLATATFVAFTMPPGGYGENQQVLSSGTGACAGAQLGVDANGISNDAFQQCAMLLFFVFDGLSFGLSLGCVMMIVVLSMPRVQWESEKAEAGRFYLLLSVTWFLLYTAVATGFASFVAAGLSVNRQVKIVIGPVVPGMLLLVVGGVLLCYRFMCLAPGWDAVIASLSFHNQDVKDVCEVERGQELFWRYWGSKLGGSAAAAAAVDRPVDLEMQHLLPQHDAVAANAGVHQPASSAATAQTHFK